MDRLQIGFALLVVAALGLGGVTTLNYSDRLGDAETALDLDEQVSVEVLDAGVEDDRFVTTVRIENPTDASVVLESAALRVHNRSTQRIAAGPASRLDAEGPTRVPPGESVEATFALSLSNSDRRGVTAALEREAFLTVNVGMRYRSATFEVVRQRNVTRGAV